jgi:hypothetical protein
MIAQANQPEALMKRALAAIPAILLVALPAFAEGETVAPALVLAPPEVLAKAQGAFGNQCDLEGEFGPDERHRAYELAYKLEGDPADQALRKAVLHEVFCMSGAYNVATVYLIDDGDGDGETGLKPVFFAMPDFRPVYEDDDYDKAVLRIDVNGFTAEGTLINAGFDAESATMTHFSKWRGIGDASSTGTWRFLGGRFVLTRFEVDASYDGEINPTIIYDAQPETP